MTWQCPNLRSNALSAPRKHATHVWPLPNYRRMASPAQEHDRCAALKRVWPGFVDSLAASWSAKGAAAVPVPPAPGWQMRGVWPPSPRVVAIGDLHGDLGKARAALRTADVIDANDRWCGGTSVVVQVGDILDRGDDEVAIFHLLHRLQGEALRAGGRLHVMNGNHESMNVVAAQTQGGRFRYATAGGMEAYRHWADTQRFAAALKLRCGVKQHPHLAPGSTAAEVEPAGAARAQSMCADCPFSRLFLHGKPVALQIGSTLFTHGGWVPEHASHGIDAVNAAADAWMRGASYPSNTPPAAASPPLPPVLGGSRAVVWSRGHGWPNPAKCDCADLTAALAATPSGPARVVVGHTIQQGGINAVCDGAAIRVDVGMSAGCGNGNVQVLEILEDGKAGIYVLSDSPHGVIRTRVPTAEAAFAALKEKKERAAAAAGAHTADAAGGAPQTQAAAHASASAPKA